MSYSQSPSFTQTQHRGRRETADSGRKEKENVHSNYGDRLKKSLERKTMAPLVASYQSDIASRQRAAALAEAERMIDRGNKYRGITDLKHVDTNESAEKPGPRSKSRESAVEAREVYMREESRKFNEQISSNM